MQRNIIIGLVSLALVSPVQAGNDNGRPDRGRHLGNRQRVERQDHRRNEHYRGRHGQPTVIVNRPAPRPVVVVQRPAPRPVVVVQECPPAPPYPGPTTVYTNPYDQVGTGCGTTASVATGVCDTTCGTTTVVHEPSRDKVRLRNGILIAAAVNELTNDGRGRVDVRKGALAATLLNELFNK